MPTSTSFRNRNSNMGINPSQHWVFFFLFAMVLIFCLGVILTGPIPSQATQGQLVNVAGHQAILISPRLSTTRTGFVASSSVRDIRGDGPVLVVHPDSLMQLSIDSGGKASTEAPDGKTSGPMLVVHPDSVMQLRGNSSGKASTGISNDETKSNSRSRPSRHFLLFGCVVASALLGAKSGRKLMKSKNGLKAISFLAEDSLEDDLAFDIAYTTAPSEVGYGSFVSSWAGDLEKFDV